MFSFIRLNESYLEKVLQWRTQSEVTRYMLTDIEYNLENQYNWFERIKNSESEKYWVIRSGDVDIGIVSLNGIDLANQRTSAGYYVGEPSYRRLGGLILPYLYNYVFNTLNLNKITAEILEGNNNIMKLHDIYGFRQVGIFKQHIYKYDKYHDLYIFELLKEGWIRLENKYKKYVADF